MTENIATIQYSDEVQDALTNGKPLVALESTIISHGLPRPQNLSVAKEVQSIVRQRGAVPATIAVIDGVVHIGLSDSQLEAIANRDDIAKSSSRDLAIYVAQGKSAATTVATTAHLALFAGISVFATGGIGGVHRGAKETYDESADLSALSMLGITIVCAGVKSILDIGATLERLETLAVDLVGYRTNIFPGFYLIDSGFTIEHRVDSVAEIVAILRARVALRTDRSALIVANPVAKEMDRARHDEILATGLALAKAQGITGKGVTPFLLEHFHSSSQGESLRVNIEIIKSNAALAADIAVASNK